MKHIARIAGLLVVLAAALAFDPLWQSIHSALKNDTFVVPNYFGEANSPRFVLYYALQLATVLMLVRITGLFGRLGRGGYVLGGLVLGGVYLLVNPTWYYMCYGIETRLHTDLGGWYAYRLNEIDSFEVVGVLASSAILMAAEALRRTLVVLTSPRPGDDLPEPRGMAPESGLRGFFARLRRNRGTNGVAQVSVVR